MRADTGSSRLLGVIALGLLAKPSVVTLPFVLLLLDYWPLGRLGRPGAPAPGAARAVAEKLPLLALSAGVSALTLAVQRSWGAMAPLAGVEAGDRAANAAVAYAAYLRQAIWPRGLRSSTRPRSTASRRWRQGRRVSSLRP